MKDEGLIKSLFKTIKAKTEADKENILEYCKRELLIHVDFHINQHEGITFDEFLIWINENPPEVGQVIVYESSYDTIGIISSITPDEIVLGVVLIGEDLITTNVSRPIWGYRKATNVEIHRIHHSLAKKGFSWNLWYNRFARYIYIPRKNSFVKYRSFIGSNHGIGIFRGINALGETELFCNKPSNAPIQYSMHEIIGEANQFQFAAASKKEIKILKEELLQVDKIWNGYLSRIQPIDFSIEDGQEYCYITDRGSIKYARKNGTSTHRERVAIGNIFTSPQQAQNFLMRIQEIRNSDLCKPIEKR